jgi:hypothetical protein
MITASVVLLLLLLLLSASTQQVPVCATTGSPVLLAMPSISVCTPAGLAVVLWCPDQHQESHCWHIKLMHSCCIDNLPGS